MCCLTSPLVCKNAGISRHLSWKMGGGEGRRSNFVSLACCQPESREFPPSFVLFTSMELIGSVRFFPQYRRSSRAAMSHSNLELPFPRPNTASACCEELDFDMSDRKKKLCGKIVKDALGIRMGSFNH
jgi:hypothetical protein